MAKEKDVDSLLSVSEVSKKIGLSPSIVYTVLNYEKMPHVKIGGRIVVKESELNDWAKKNVRQIPLKKATNKEEGKR